jgi:uncharacterized membrane protein YhaH (DUF805 family)
MQIVRFLLSPSGRLEPRPFIYGAIAVYLAGAASHVLTMSAVITRVGLWPFMAAQVVLIWIWFALHARRLRDAGHPIGIAAGASLLYALSIVLLLVVVLGFFDTSVGPMSNPAAGAALNLILVLRIIASLLGSLQLDLTWLLIAILTVLAFVPIIVTVAVTLWAATRPTAENRS